ncbi:MAG: hypothetical protein Q7T29_00960 [Gallionella sp.]|nr:hypothetical protein [Gallionella sp.]
MLDDLAKTVKAQLYERVSSPLLGAFGISWIAWNYRFVLVLVSSMPTADKFMYIDSNIFDSYQKIFLHGTLYPLLTTLSLIFIYPFPAKFVYEYWRKRQRDLKEIQQRIDDETPLTREEARELRHETLNARLEFEQELERRTGEIARLKETIKELQFREKPDTDRPSRKSAKPTPPQTAGTNTTLDENQVKMLKKIAEPGAIRKDALISSSGKDKILAEYNLGELEAKNYVKVGYNSELMGTSASITHSGRAYLINQTRNNNLPSTS